MKDLSIKIASALQGLLGLRSPSDIPANIVEMAQKVKAVRDRVGGSQMINIDVLAMICVSCDCEITEPRKIDVDSIAKRTGDLRVFGIDKLRRLYKETIGRDAGLSASAGLLAGIIASAEEASGDEPVDAPVDAPVKAAAKGPGAPALSFEDRVDQLKDDFTVPQLQELYEKTLGQAPHHSMKETGLAQSIARAEAKNEDD